MFSVGINLLASGLVGIARRESTPGELLRRWHAGEFELVLSLHISQNLQRVLRKRYFQPRFTTAELQRIDALLNELARFVDLTVPVSGVAPDEDDDLVLATAVSGEVDYLVTDERGVSRGRYYPAAVCTDSGRRSTSQARA